MIIRMTRPWPPRPQDLVVPVIMSRGPAELSGTQGAGELGQQAREPARARRTHARRAVDREAVGDAESLVEVAREVAHVGPVGDRHDDASSWR
jgi:hypothetical protein